MVATAFVRARRSLLLLAVLGTLTAVLAAPPADPRKPGTIKMAATLERVAARVNPMDNPFLNRQRAALPEHLQKTLERGPAAGCRCRP